MLNHLASFFEKSVDQCFPQSKNIPTRFCNLNSLPIVFCLKPEWYRLLIMGTRYLPVWKNSTLKVLPLLFTNPRPAREFKHKCGSYAYSRKKEI